MLYEDRYRSVTVVQHSVDGALKPWGNGFFVDYKGRLYLVTCRHMVRADRPNSQGVFYRPEELVFKLRTKVGQAIQNYTVRVLNPRKWRTSATLDTLADVAVIELDRGALLPEYDIEPWREADLLPDSDLPRGERIWVLTHPKDYGDIPIPYYVRALMKSPQVADRQAAIRVSASSEISFGNSGSLVYRVINGECSRRNPPADAHIQAVGIVAGANKWEPRTLLIEYVAKAISIFNSTEDLFDEDGVVIIRKTT
jgi:hypothetical protein